MRVAVGGTALQNPQNTIPGSKKESLAGHRLLPCVTCNIGLGSLGDLPGSSASVI